MINRKAIFNSKLESILIITLFHEGYNSKQISEILNVPDETIRGIKRRHKEIKLNLLEFKNFFESTYDMLIIRTQKVKKPFQRPLSIEKTLDDLHYNVYLKAEKIVEKNKQIKRYYSVDYSGIISLKTHDLLFNFTMQELNSLVEKRIAMWEGDRSTVTAKYFFSIYPVDDKN